VRRRGRWRSCKSTNNAQRRAPLRVLRYGAMRAAAPAARRCRQQMPLLPRRCCQRERAARLCLASWFMAGAAKPTNSHSRQRHEFPQVGSPQEGNKAFSKVAGVGWLQVGREEVVGGRKVSSGTEVEVEGEASLQAEGVAALSSSSIPDAAMCAGEPGLLQPPSCRRPLTACR